MNNYETHLKEILKTLNEDNILKDVILIGSWSLLFYKKIFLEFKPQIRTTDIDFYVPDVKAIKSNGGITVSLKELNYEMLVDTLTNKTKFSSIDGFELEFLTKLNRQGLSCVKIGNTKIYAESLPYVDIFNGNYIEIDFEGLTVKVASPSSYVLQKLLINSDRKSEKRVKDIESIKYVLDFIHASQKHTRELQQLFSNVPKSWKKRIIKSINDNDIILK